MGPRFALVAAGGAVGTLLRYAAGAVWAAPPGGVPWPTLGVNVTGALLLGIVVARHARTDARRLFLGTGVLGGYTTFGTVGVQLAELGREGDVISAGVYAVASIVGGVLAAWAGLALGSTAGAAEGAADTARSTTETPRRKGAS